MGEGAKMHINRADLAFFCASQCHPCAVKRCPISQVNGYPSTLRLSGQVESITSGGCHLYDKCHPSHDCGSSVLLFHPGHHRKRVPRRISAGIRTASRKDSNNVFFPAQSIDALPAVIREAVDERQGGVAGWCRFHIFYEQFGAYVHTCENRNSRPTAVCIPRN